ncbi:MAG: 5-dehydro-4-deoxy-D-glucuronate isomerase [Oscillospiraceae bacterium]|nr:5-dehydro-4-deoxy-D-glucuronate isomerase [Oscillospiraceae bacterium]
MDIRYSANQKDVRRYTTEELRDEFLITDLYQPDQVSAVYSHVDRMVVLGIMPVKEALPIDKGINVMSNFGTEYFLERREVGFFNLGGPGVCTVDGTAYKLGPRDCIYITKGSQEVTFQSDNPSEPAKFYGVSAPAHKACETRLLTIAEAAKNPLGSAETSNKRVINQFIHPAVLETCQLLMGLTILEPGSVWNTMPPHTHERRMEVYTYFDIPENGAVFHFMGEPKETRHLVIQNYDAIISPSWSIHSGCGTANYAFIWAMGGENQTFTDMDTMSASDLR